VTENDALSKWSAANYCNLFEEKIISRFSYQCWHMCF